MSSKVQIKICGINSNKSAEACNGADFIGFVFYQKSPRFVTAFEAKEISKYLQTNLKKVGLFVNSEINLIKHISEFVNLDVIQLHGTETINFQLGFYVDKPEKRGREHTHDRVQGGSTQTIVWCTAIYGSIRIFSQPH